jgi:hypothetical protein
LLADVFFTKKESGLLKHKTLGQVLRLLYTSVPSKIQFFLHVYPFSKYELKYKNA